MFENMTSFTPILSQDLEQGKLMAGAKFSEMKVQKTCVVLFVIDLNVTRYRGKT